MSGASTPQRRWGGVTTSDMVVTLRDSKTMACAFPYALGTVARIKTLPDRRFDKDTKAWLVPVRDFERVLTLFPDASIDVPVWAAVYPSNEMLMGKALTFCRNLTAMGVSLVHAGANIVAVGEIATPVLQAEVDKRAEWIGRLMARGHVFTAVERPKRTEQHGGGLFDQGGEVDEIVALNAVIDAALGADWPDAAPDSELAVVWKGIQNAAVREREKAQWAQARRRRDGGKRRQKPLPVEQPGLGL